MLARLSAIRLSDYCCQAEDRTVDLCAVDLKSLIIAQRGRTILRFSPLGNNPSEPKLVLVGITPGSQSEVFADLLRSCSVELAAKRAAFAKGSEQIKDLLNAHGFARQLGIDLSGDLNDNPALFTTSLVKCCLMVDGSYKYKAPDILGSPEAKFCVCNRFVADITKYPTLEWVVIFGKAGWEAVNLLTVGPSTIRQHLEAQGMEVLNFPHFAQNFQQHAIFKLRLGEEEGYFKEHPKHRPYAAAARSMRDGLLAALQRKYPTWDMPRTRTY
jgi:hypothetical protein